MSIPRSTRLIDVLQPYDDLLIITHDNPDPDAIAAGWAVRRLIQERLGKSARLIGGGAIVRAENRHMLKLLQPPIELVDELTLPENTATILVDCSTTTANHLLGDSQFQPVAVIDHHETNGRGRRIPFRDVRPQVAASATITASYLREKHIDPSPDLATALLYAISTETKGSEFHYSQLDRRIVAWLSEIADLTKLAEIESAPLTRGYYSDLVLSLQSTFVYDEVGLCYLPRAEGAEIIGEVADLLVRCQELQRVLCAAVIDGNVILSVRTDRGAGNAAELVQATLSGLGMGGGHQHRAGGKILLQQCACPTEQVFDELRARWLAACHVDRQRGTRLVAKRDIVRHL